MSTTKIPSKTVVQLWTKSGGRCQYEGCNTALWRDHLDLSAMNAAYIAHIVADKPGGPRGDEENSVKLSKVISNLMLLCDVHHRKIDGELRTEYPVHRLKSMKAIHENRIENLTSIIGDMKTELLLYGANIGEQQTYLSVDQAIHAVIPKRYPNSTHGLQLGMKNSSFKDADLKFWEIEELHLRSMFNQFVRPRLNDGTLKHISVFALAPQPLLILLGTLLSDIQDSEVFQLHREPKGWQWQPSEETNFKVLRPSKTSGSPALIISLSGSINSERVLKINPNFTPWILTVDTPHNDFLKSQKQLSELRSVLRKLLDEIKKIHGEKEVIHVFPAMPVSAAVELGRVLMPKADLPLKVYDQNNQSGGFVFTLNLNARGTQNA